MILVNDLSGIIEVLAELGNDNTVPRNVKLKLSAITLVLENSSERSIKIDKALQELEEITDDGNLQPYVRTQLWNIASMLEKVNI